MGPPVELSDARLQAEAFVAGMIGGVPDEAPQGCFRAADWTEADAILATWGPGIDVRELCGGLARSA